MQQPAINTASWTKYVLYFSDDIFKYIYFISHFTYCTTDEKSALGSGDGLPLVQCQVIVQIIGDWVQWVKVNCNQYVSNKKYNYRYHTNRYAGFSACCYKICFTTQNIFVKNIIYEYVYFGVIRARGYTWVNLHRRLCFLLKGSKHVHLVVPNCANRLWWHTALCYHPSCNTMVRQIL